MPGIPKGHKVLESGKERGKGFYRIVQRPNGTVYKLWDRLFSPAELQSRVDAANKNEGQLSRDNIIGNTKAAMGLAAAAGGAGALTYYNFGQDRQGKVPRKIRGAAFGKTRPQGVGLKTQAASAGDVRGRVVSDRPPAIVRSAGSFNQRGSAMPQQGNLFDQPEPPSGKKKAPGRRYAPAGTAKSTGKGTRGVPRPTPRASGKAAGPAPKTPVTQARPTPLNPNRNTGPWRPTPINPDYKVPGPKPYVDQRYQTTDPLKSGSMPYGSTGASNIPSDYWTNRNRMNIGIPGNPNDKFGWTTTGGTPNWRRYLNPLQGEKSMLRPSPLNPDVPDAPSGGTQKSGTRYAPAGTAKATNKGTRGVPRPAPRSNFKPATGGTPVPEPSTKPTARTTPVQRGSAAPRTPSPSLPARNTSPATGKYSGRSTGVSTKPKTPAELKAIEDAMRARRAGTGGTSLSGQRTALRPTPLAPSRVPNSPSGPLTGDRTALRPTPINPNRPTPLNPKYTPTQARPTPLNPEPLVPNSPLKPGKPSLLGRVKGFAKGFGGPGLAVGHLIEDAVSGVQSAAQGDWKNAGRRANDLLGHGTPLGAANFVISDVGTVLRGQKIARGKPTSIGDRIIHGKLFPDSYYSDDEAQKATRTPAASGGNKPAGGTSQKPSGPAYFPEAGRNGSAVRTPDSYLGEAFDYSLQKGTNSGTKYLEHMFRRDKISEDDQQRLRERFNKKVVGDQTLKDEGASRGITQNVEGKKAGLGKELLDQYRANNAGNPLPNYKGNTDYGNMRAAAEARLAKK